MALFAPKISPLEMRTVQGILKQLKESDALVHSTVQPDVFFKRLNLVFDRFLALRPYEKYKIFKPITPTENYNRILQDMESLVNAFLDRAIADHQAKLATMKNEAAKKARNEKFATSLLSAFDCANSFWQGDLVSPHYDGPLFVMANYKRVTALYDATFPK